MAIDVSRRKLPPAVLTGRVNEDFIRKLAAEARSGKIASNPLNVGLTAEEVAVVLKRKFPHLTEIQKSNLKTLIQDAMDGKPPSTLLLDQKTYGLAPPQIRALLYPYFQKARQ